MSKPASPMLRPVSIENSALLRRVDAQERKHLDATFDDMDVDADGHVSTSEFTRYLSRNPRGWPLGDLLDGQPADVRAQMIEFWFRKIDLQSEGYITKEELAAFFAAMKVTTFREQFMADFLLNLFDVDLDQRLNRVEMKRMLRVMIGHEPDEKVVNHLCGRTGSVSREELVGLLHEVKCSLPSLERSRAATVGGATLTDYLVIATMAAAAVGAGLFIYRRVAGASA
eukprot:CAMPEP_0174840344 /NCGR_PEP_ID=MMETSP1114-20130205/8625_1 /TAXON_ID=312471 /ORGANISM="Neobodo designis, Strain CCAP 1951/1" /LENGTH=226 /DNA_ID=CAMNT_0016074489 /DNA_START=90 /DNA_END=770 /DNA_ORIENTATION=+